MSTEGLDPAFADKMNRLIAATGGRISIKSGYRSVERQTQLWNAALKKYGSPQAARRWVAPPGRSNHNHGLAVDLAFKDPAAKQLAHRLAPQFGLIFPMSWEPWHIEPVGARDKAHSEAYTTPSGGGLHPHDPEYAKTNPAFIAASLAEAMTRTPATSELENVLAGGFTGDNESHAGHAHEEQAVPSSAKGATGAGGDSDAWIRQAMQITGVSEDWYPGLRRRMNQESGGRNIPQKIVDVNTRKGTPAFGPMQVIEPTFNRWKMAGLENWRDPLHNTVAAIRYIQSRYGHPDKLPKGGY